MPEDLIVKPITDAAAVEPAPTPIPEVTPTAVVAESAPVTEPTPEPTEVEGAEPRESKVVRELKDQRRKRQDAERDAAYWRGIAEGRAKPTEPSPIIQPAPVTLTKEPTIDQYEKYDDFLVAKAEWNVEQKTISKRVQEEESEVQRIFTERIQKAAETDPDISDVLNDRTLSISNAMAAVIRRMEIAPQVLRYLSNNRNEAARISRLSPLVAAAEIGKIEMKLTSVPKTETKKVSQAPEPIQTVKPTGVIPIDEDSMSTPDWIAKRNQAQYKVRR